MLSLLLIITVCFATAFCILLLFNILFLKLLIFLQINTNEKFVINFSVKNIGSVLPRWSK